MDNLDQKETMQDNQMQDDSLKLSMHMKQADKELEEIRKTKQETRSRVEAALRKKGDLTNGINQW